MELKKGKNEKLFSWKSTISPYQILQILEKKLGIKIKGRGLHGFRRSFADRLSANGVAIQDTQHILRHRDITTTSKYYINMYKNKLIKEMNEKLK